MNLVDLDDIAGLQRAWAELERVRAVRLVDPEYRAAIERLLPRLDPDDAEQVRSALDEFHPAAVADAFFEILAASVPTIGWHRRSGAT